MGGFSAVPHPLLIQRGDFLPSNQDSLWHCPWGAVKTLLGMFGHWGGQFF